MAIPPGIELIFKDILPNAFKLPFITLLLLKLLQQSPFGVNLPTWAWVGALATVHPANWIVSTLYNMHRVKNEAAARGAMLVPRVKGGSFELIGKIRNGYMAEGFFEWSRQYGQTYIFPIFGVDRIMTMEPEHIKAILATQFDDFHKGEMDKDQFNSLLGSGVFNSDGEMWKFHRNMTRPFFSKVRISDYDLFERHAEETLSVLADRLAQGYPVDFQDAVARFTLDSATQFLFGKAVDSTSAGLPYPPSSSSSYPSSFLTSSLSSETYLTHPSTKFVTAFAQGQEAITLRGVRGKYWRLFEFWKDEAAGYRKDVEEFVNPILDEAIKSLMRKEEGDMNSGSVSVKEVGEEETFLEHLVKATKEKKVVMDELLNILLAARDTTASLLTFSVYVLTQRPDILARLKSEISEKVGFARRPTYEDTREMKYLRAFLNETLRLYPSVPVDGRSPKHATTLPNKNGKPWYVPAETRCVYSVFLMHRREDLWGPDALEFDPDRFLDERLHKYLTPNPFIFLPFNAGPRICLGQQFAYNEASYFLIKLLQKFDNFSHALDVQPSQPPPEWKPEPGTTKGRDKITLFSHLTMSVKDGLWIRMKSLHETLKDGQK
ncbi:cytochrome P450 monooxygenase pc-3 [Dendrothele bispora CBS 962.96]|uniref:Cytochrome P450 monooxygenase pc-3 n=1 Tax=Dendrothele bispora (strain CBS 962.96) TaxID=1314807 RepID=A0A4S8MEY0_DENBC|nr:cytochrome P450 monooxygenase pc-3 [Dendrothele bispora CBS 962.96]